MNVRRIALGASATLLAIGTVVGMGAGVAGAAKPVVSATGTANCSATGKIKASPALAIPGSNAPATLTTKVTISGCTGTSGVVSGKGTFTSQVPTNNCTALQTTDPLPATGTIKWKGAAKYSPSAITFSDSSSTTSDPITSTAPGSGTSTITGSFANEHALSKEVLDQGVAELLAGCTGKGIKKLSFTGVHGASTFKITP